MEQKSSLQTFRAGASGFEFVGGTRVFLPNRLAGWGSPRAAVAQTELAGPAGSSVSFFFFMSPRSLSWGPWELRRPGCGRQSVGWARCIRGNKNEIFIPSAPGTLRNYLCFRVYFPSNIPSLTHCFLPNLSLVSRQGVMLYIQGLCASKFVCWNVIPSGMSLGGGDFGR